MNQPPASLNPQAWLKSWQIAQATIQTARQSLQTREQKPRTPLRRKQ